MILDESGYSRDLLPVINSLSAMLTGPEAENYASQKRIDSFARSVWATSTYQWKKKQGPRAQSSSTLEAAHVHAGDTPPASNDGPALEAPPRGPRSS
ncbi:hypothetical protein PCASD_09610 [Puccinia coronata f. sp. avenae]|uniref:Uncharacterized protein n=1 Tax=Puccinia coronata f. sp. avenae TaxID=200324 RepID=A0A2N5T200_9BASI|nr:hypothetical protein PCASD_18941 [Puccinia coronata f. sp. avenae]PLW39740.1 hypothetical protein PCASD_09610 [Puccinia coronata f. sp. avenae]